MDNINWKSVDQSFDGCFCCGPPSYLSEAYTNYDFNRFKLLLKGIDFHRFEKVAEELCSEVTHYFDIKFVYELRDETIFRGEDTGFIVEALKKRQNGEFRFVSAKECKLEPGVKEYIDNNSI